MPPKAAKATDDGATGAIKVFLSVMKNCDSVKPSWDNVAKEIGIGYGKNAASKFKGLVEKHGYKFEGGRVTLPDEEADDNNDAASPAVKTIRTSKVAKSTNKRKTAAVKAESGDEADAKPAKKTKKVASKDEIADEKPVKPATKAKKVAPKDDTADEQPAKPATKTKKKAAPKSDAFVKEESIKGESDDQASDDEDDAKGKVETKVANVDDSAGSLLTPEEAADMV